MGFLSGQWLAYVDRSYQQIKDSVLTRLQSKTPEITDHTESDPFVNAVSIWSGLAEMEGYYIDNQGREALLDSCRLYSSGILHARRDDYRVKGKLASGMPLTFTLSAVQSGSTTIPVGTRGSQNSTGIMFATVEVAVIPAGQTTIDVNALQSIPVTALSIGNSSGAAGQEIVVGTDVQDETIVLRVAGVQWTRVDTLAYSLPGDTVFVQTIDVNGATVVIFGDGLNGKIPLAGAALQVDYKSTDGSGGNLEVGAIDTLVDAVTVGTGTIKVSNGTAGNGGYDVETLDDIKMKVPLWNRTNDRAVTPEDYKDIAILASGVAQAGIIFNCGKTVNVYIVPQGGGIANQTLIDAVSAYFDDRKMVTTKVSIFAAGQVRVKLIIDVVANAASYNAQCVSDCQAALLAFGSVTNQKVGGSVNLGDVYQLIEGLSTVDHSTINGMTTVPFAQVGDPSMPALIWTPVTQPGSTTTSQWIITMIDSTNFQVTRNNTVLGDYTVGTPLSFDEVDFTILTGSYNAGNVWSFVVYPYFGNLKLQEPSVPVILIDDIQLSVTGGLG